MIAQRAVGVLASCWRGAASRADPNPHAETTDHSGGTGSTGLIPRSACSVSSVTAVNLTLNNRSARQLRVLWVDYSCLEQSMGALAPGQSFATSTFATHPWRLRDVGTNALTFEYVTTTDPQQNLDVNVR